MPAASCHLPQTARGHGRHRRGRHRTGVDHVLTLYLHFEFAAVCNDYIRALGQARVAQHDIPAVVSTSDCVTFRKAHTSPLKSAADNCFTWLLTKPLTFCRPLCRYIQPTQATTGQGLYEGLDWLSETIKRSRQAGRRRLLHFCARRNILRYRYLLSLLYGKKASYPRISIHIH